MRRIEFDEQLEADETTRAELSAWLDAFSRAVRDVDYESGKRLFAPDVVGFGTVGVLLSGLETLIASQWKHVWGKTSGFHFDMTQLTARVAGGVAWIAIPWASRTGKNENAPLDRHGRATYVLERRAGQWLAVHSHHSLDPSGSPPGTWGRRSTDAADPRKAASSRA